jgi:hypothetical protein
VQIFKLSANRIDLAVLWRTWRSVLVRKPASFGYFVAIACDANNGVFPFPPDDAVRIGGTMLRGGAVGQFAEVLIRHPGAFLFGHAASLERLFVSLLANPDPSILDRFLVWALEFRPVFTGSVGQEGAEEIAQMLNFITSTPERESCIRKNQQALLGGTLREWLNELDRDDLEELVLTERWLEVPEVLDRLSASRLASMLYPHLTLPCVRKWVSEMKGDRKKEFCEHVFLWGTGPALTPQSREQFEHFIGVVRLFRDQDVSHVYRLARWINSRAAEDPNYDPLDDVESWIRALRPDDRVLRGLSMSRIGYERVSDAFENMTYVFRIAFVRIAYMVKWRRTMVLPWLPLSVKRALEAPTLGAAMGIAREDTDKKLHVELPDVTAEPDESENDDFSDWEPETTDDDENW